MDNAQRSDLKEVMEALHASWRAIKDLADDGKLSPDIKAAFLDEGGDVVAIIGKTMTEAGLIAAPMAVALAETMEAEAASIRAVPAHDPQTILPGQG